MARWLRLWVLPTEVWLHCPTRLCMIFAITTCASSRAVNIRTSSLKTSFIASLVFFTGIATLSHVQDTKPAPPTPIAMRRRSSLVGRPGIHNGPRSSKRRSRRKCFLRGSPRRAPILPAILRDGPNRQTRILGLLLSGTRVVRGSLSIDSQPKRGTMIGAGVPLNLPWSVTGPISVEGVSCGCRARTPEKSDSGQRIPSAFQSSKPFD
jgi:hypothetical protein